MGDRLIKKGLFCCFPTPAQKKFLSASQKMRIQVYCWCGIIIKANKNKKYNDKTMHNEVE
jgi:hypothetical protein